MFQISNSFLIQEFPLFQVPQAEKSRTEKKTSKKVAPIKTHVKTEKKKKKLHTNKYSASHEKFWVTFYEHDISFARDLLRFGQAVV